MSGWLAAVFGALWLLLAFVGVVLVRYLRGFDGGVHVIDLSDVPVATGPHPGEADVWVESIDSDGMTIPRVPSTSEGEGA